MKLEEIEKGWVVASMGGSFILSYTFERTRSASIKKWMGFWDPKKCSWRKFRREGYKCVRATRVISRD